VFFYGASISEVTEIWVVCILTQKMQKPCWLRHCTTDSDQTFFEEQSLHGNHGFLCSVYWFANRRIFV